MLGPDGERLGLEGNRLGLRLGLRIADERLVDRRRRLEVELGAPLIGRARTPERELALVEGCLPLERCAVDERLALGDGLVLDRRRLGLGRLAGLLELEVGCLLALTERELPLEERSFLLFSLLERVGLGLELGHGVELEGLVEQDAVGRCFPGTVELRLALELPAALATEGELALVE